jgi:DNA-binding MarR family transcriptional regulator
MSEAPLVQQNIEDGQQLRAEVQAYGHGLDVNSAALELHSRMALTEAAVNGALVRRFRKIGLSKAIAQYGVLHQLSFAEDHRMTQHDLSRRLSVTSSDISRMVSGLERDGLVRRLAKLPPGSKGDARLAHVSLTERGLQRAYRSIPVVLAYSIDLAKGFTDEELKILLGLLTRLEARVKALDNS